MYQQFLDFATSKSFRNHFLKLGLVGGAIWNFFGGIRNAPNGARMTQALSRMKARTPILGGRHDPHEEYMFSTWLLPFQIFLLSGT
jgi:hypothetical protein